MQVKFFLVCLMACSAVAQFQQKRPDPIPILKQISKQNDDGSYSFGYEAGDGSFKIETKYPDGSVQGKYGYVDDSGKLREVEYGASKNRGFEPSGNDINVPPPTISQERPGPLADGQEDDGQYREDPSIYDSKEYRNSLPATKTKTRPVQQSFKFQTPAQPTYSTYEEPAQNNFKFQQPTRQTFSNYQQPQYSGVQQSFSNYQQPQYSGVQQTFPRFQQPTFENYQQPQTFQQYQQPQVSQYYSSYNGHPSVKNFDIGTGSYSINYSGR